MKKLYTGILFLLGSTFLHAQNNALVFDGIDDYVDCGTNAAFNPASIKTVEGWVKFNSLAKDQEIFSRSIGGNGLEVLVFGSNLCVYAMKGPDYSFIQYPVSNLQTGLWYHIAFAWDGTTRESMRLYVNGVSVGTRTDGGNINTSGVPAPAGSFRIGDWSDGTHRYLSGAVDEVRVWNVMLSSSQIKQAMTNAVSSSTSGLVASYTANETSGTTLTNSTTTPGLNGTLTNGVARAASPVQFANNSLSFDGVDDQVTVPANSAFELTSGTLECWIKPGLMNYNGTIMANRGSGGTRYSFHINTNPGSGITPTIGLWNNGIYNTVSYPFVVGQWYHVAFVCSGTATSIYVDGTFQGQVASAFSSVTGQPFTVGVAKNSGADGEFFLGDIDEVRVWSTQRTQTELQANKDLSLKGNESGLVALYTFNQGVASGANSGILTVPDMTANNRHATLANFALTGSTSNFTGHYLTALPVRLTAFSAAQKQGTVLLQWQTAEERSISGYDVERSADGLRYQRIGGVGASGNSTGSYTFTDATPLGGTGYYRLRINEENNTHSYSPVRTVRSAESHSLTSAADGNGAVVLTLENGTNEAYAIHDLNGRVIASGRLAQGRARVQALAAGVYVAAVASGAENLTVKFAVQ